MIENLINEVKEIINRIVNIQKRIRKINHAIEFPECEINKLEDYIRKLQKILSLDLETLSLVPSNQGMLACTRNYVQGLNVHLFSFEELINLKIEGYKKSKERVLYGNEV